MEQVPARPARSPGPSPLPLGRGCPLGLQRPVTCCVPTPLLPARPAQSPRRPVTCCVTIPPPPARLPHPMLLLAGPCAPALSKGYPLRLELRLPGACRVPPEHSLPEPGSLPPLYRARADLIWQCLLALAHLLQLAAISLLSYRA